MAEANSQVATKLYDALVQGFGQLGNSVRNVVRPYGELAGKAYDAAEDFYYKNAPSSLKSFIRDYERIPQMPSPSKLKVLTATDDIIDVIPKLAPAAKAFVAKVPAMAARLPEMTQAASWDSLIDAAKAMGPEGLKPVDLNSVGSVYLKKVSDLYDVLRRNMLENDTGTRSIYNRGAAALREATAGNLPAVNLTNDLPREVILDLSPSHHSPDMLQTSLAMAAAKAPEGRGTLAVTNIGDPSTRGLGWAFGDTAWLNPNVNEVASIAESFRNNPRKYYGIAPAAETQLAATSGGIAHEDNHITQYLNNRGILRNYPDPKVDFPGYWSHPAEVDSRNAANRMIETYRNAATNLFPNSQGSFLGLPVRGIAPLINDIQRTTLDLRGIQDLRDKLRGIYGDSLRYKNPGEMLTDPGLGDFLKEFADKYGGDKAQDIRNMFATRYGIRPGGLVKTKAEQDNYLLQLLNNAFLKENELTNEGQYRLR